MGRNLEEIFWREGKFFDSNSNEIKNLVTAVESPKIISLADKQLENLSNIIFHYISDSEIKDGANAFLKGEEIWLDKKYKEEYYSAVPIQLYKI